jgi:hypothetical protein
MFLLRLLSRLLALPLVAAGLHENCAALVDPIPALYMAPWIAV